MRLIFVAMLVISFLAVPAVAPAAPTFPQFGAQVVLPSSTGDGEPSIATDGAGVIYVASPGSGDVRAQAGVPVSVNGGTITVGFQGAHTHVYRSANGGASFARVADTLGASGDSDVATDADGKVYVSDLSSNVPVSVSANNATSFSFLVPTAAGGSLDRQWLLASGHGNVWSFYRDSSTERVGISHDGGLTYTIGVVVPTDVAWTGNPVSRDGVNFYFPWTSSSAGDLHVAASHDGGVTWTSHTAGAIVSGPELFPAVAVDAAGIVYVAWADLAGSLGAVHVAHSSDSAVTFSAPVTVSPDGPYTMFPWLLADAAGHVAVFWYEGDEPSPVAFGSDASAASWSLAMAYATDASSATPHWTTQRIATAIHTGSICDVGILCPPLYNPLVLNREFLDFFEATELPNGNIAVVFDVDGPAVTQLAQTQPELHVLVQNGGPNLK